jgi:hypothetical protein
MVQALGVLFVGLVGVHRISFFDVLQGCVVLMFVETGVAEMGLC